MKNSKFRGPENPETKKLVAMLEKAARKGKARIWSDVAEFLLKPARQRKAHALNLYKLDKLAKDGDVIVIPTNLLGVGETSKKITVGVFRSSKSAEQKLGKNLVSIQELVQKHPDGKNVRIIVG